MYSQEEIDAFYNEPKQRQAEVIVAHRIGYYNADIDSVSSEEIAEADAYLEAHIQWRIQQARDEVAP